MLRVDDNVEAVAVVPLLGLGTPLLPGNDRCCHGCGRWGWWYIIVVVSLRW